MSNISKFILGWITGWVTLFICYSFVANAVNVVTVGPRSPNKDIPLPRYSICSPYTTVGEPCIWQAGVDIPIMSTGPSHYISMVTLVLPPTNPGWELYRSDFNFTLDFVYLSDCKNNVLSYKNDAYLYKNDTVCK